MKRLLLSTKMIKKTFQKIEELIEAVVRKVPMPAHLGDGPEYDPKKFAGRGKRSYGGKKELQKAITDI